MSNHNERTKIMNTQRKIELLQKAYKIINNKDHLNNLECAQTRDYVNMVLDALIDEQFTEEHHNNENNVIKFLYDNGFTAAADAVCREKAGI